MNIALKEWASVVSALGEGKQSVLVRKGGIVEAKLGFQLKHPEFLLFPTYEHQNPELVREEFRHLISTEEPADITIGWIARVQDVRTLAAGEHPPDHLHIYSPQFFVIREQYRPDLPLYQITVRVEALPQEKRIPNRPSYAGCKSWVYLTEEI